MVISVKEIRALLKAVCQPVVTPPQFKKRLLGRLIREAERERK